MKGPAISISIAGLYGGASTVNLNAGPATIRQGQGFFAGDTKISHFWINLRTLGTSGNINLKFEIFADSGGSAPIPTGDALATHSVSGIAAANNDFLKFTPDWSGLTLVVGTRYWLVITNESSAPGTDYVSVNSRIDSFWGAWGDAYNAAASYDNISRRFNGTDWTTVVAASGSCALVVYTSGVRSGTFAAAGITSYVAGFTSTSSVQAGWEIVIPNGIPIHVVGVIASIASSRRSVVQLYRNRVKVFEGSESQDFSSLIDNVSVDCDIVLNPGDRLAVLIANPGWTANTAIQFNPMTDDQDFMRDIPYSPRLVSHSSGVWTESALRGLPAITLLLDPVNPFVESINRRKFYAAR